jgi:hypothetical protein
MFGKRERLGKTLGNFVDNSETLKFVEVEVIDNGSCKMKMYEEHP